MCDFVEEVEKLHVVWSFAERGVQNAINCCLDDDEIVAGRQTDLNASASIHRVTKSEKSETCGCLYQHG